MKAWRLTFKGQYPDHQEDLVASTVVDAVALADKFFRKTGVHIDTKKDLIDVRCLSDDIVREDDVK